MRSSVYQPAEVQTCDSLRQLKGTDVPDAEMQDLVSRQVYGVSAAEAEANRKKREEEKRKAAEERDARIEKEPCGRIYPAGSERTVCRWYSATTPGVRTDEELRASVGKVLKSMEMDPSIRQSVTEAAQRLEQDDVTESILQKEAEARKLVDERRQAAAAARLDAQLKRGEVGFLLHGWTLSGFGVVLVARFWLQNNTGSLKKDFVIQCVTAGESGTPLSAVRKTLYQSLKPHERRSFELDVGLVNSQSARASCGVIGWN